MVQGCQFAYRGSRGRESLGGFDGKELHMTREAIIFRRSWLELFDVVTALDIAEILAMLQDARRSIISRSIRFDGRATARTTIWRESRRSAAIGMRPRARRTGKSTSILFGAWLAACASASCSMMASPIPRRPKTAASSLSNEASSRGSSLLALFDIRRGAAIRLQLGVTRTRQNDLSGRNRQQMNSTASIRVRMNASSCIE